MLTFSFHISHGHDLPSVKKKNKKMQICNRLYIFFLFHNIGPETTCTAFKEAVN